MLSHFDLQPDLARYYARPLRAQASHPQEQHTDILPGLEFGADGHLVVATTNDLQRARDVTISQQQQPRVLAAGWCRARLFIDTRSLSEPSAPLLSALCG